MQPLFSFNLNTQVQKTAKHTLETDTLKGFNNEKNYLGRKKS